MRISAGATRAAAIAGLVLLAVACAGTLRADDRVPFVRLREVDGHLKFETCLPPGRGSFQAVDPAGLKLAGFVFVSGEAEAKKPRIFRLRGTIGDDAEAEDRGDDRPAPFLIKLRTTVNPDHYELHVEVEQFSGGQPVKCQATLGRNCCGYYVTAAKPDRKFDVGRGALLTDLMVAVPETYGEFERLAEICCRPGFEFVPGSLLSPRVVEEVIAADEAEPTSEAAAAFQILVQDLDSEQFAARESAAAQLIRGGRTTLWSLDHLKADRLSAEQRHQLVRVRQALVTFSDPVLPFSVSGDEVRALSSAPPASWLSQLSHSTDARVANWARERAGRSAGAAAAETCAPHQQH